MCGSSPFQELQPCWPPGSDKPRSEPAELEPAEVILKWALASCRVAFLQTQLRFFLSARASGQEAEGRASEQLELATCCAFLIRRQMMMMLLSFK